MFEQEQWLPVSPRVTWSPPWKCRRWFVIELLLTWSTYETRAQLIINTFVYLMIASATSEVYQKGWLVFYISRERSLWKTGSWLLANPNSLCEPPLLLLTSLTKAGKTGGVLKWWPHSMQGVILGDKYSLSLPGVLWTGKDFLQRCGWIYEELQTVTTLWLSNFTLGNLPKDRVTCAVLQTL